MVDVLASADVITVATGNDIRDLWPALARANGLRDRPAAFLVFANAQRASSDLIERARRETKSELEHFLACDVVCDCICTAGYAETCDDGQDEWIVLAEDFRDVTIQAEGMSRTILAPLMEGAPGVRLTAGAKEFDAYEKRKAWLMNAAHYAIGALGWSMKGIDAVDSAARDGEISRAVELMQREFCLALLMHMNENCVDSSGDLALDSLLAYADSVRQRIASGPPDNLDRVFGALIGYANQGKMHADLAELVKTRGDQALQEQLSAADLEHVERCGEHLTVPLALRQWGRIPQIQHFRQSLWSFVNDGFASLVLRIGLASFFEKARARLHEPLGLMLSEIAKEGSQGRYPVHATIALLAIEDTVRYFVGEAESRLRTPALERS